MSPDMDQTRGRRNTLGLYEYQKEIVGYGPNAEGRGFGIMLDGDRIRAEACVPDAAGRWTPDTNWHPWPPSCPSDARTSIKSLSTLTGRGWLRPTILLSARGQPRRRRVTTDGSGRFDTASDPLKIGGIPTVDYAYAFNGSLSEVRIYDRSLSPAEIAVLHGDPQRATNRGLVAGYHLDEGRGSNGPRFLRTRQLRKAPRRCDVGIRSGNEAGAACGALGRRDAR